jgi:hypothetical protein
VLKVVAGELPDQLPRLDDLLGIETRRRLVENQHVGVVNQRLCEANALLVALGQLRAEPVRHLGDPRPIHDRLHPMPAVGSRDALDLSDEVQVFDDGHVGVEGRRFRQVTGSTLRFDRLVEHVEAGDDGLAGCGRHVPRQDPHRRGLAGAIGPEESQDLASLHAEADVVHGGYRAVPFAEVLNLDHV